MPVSKRHRQPQCTTNLSSDAFVLRCARCDGEACFVWQKMVNGRKHLRAECARCKRFIKFARQVKPFTTLADEYEKGVCDAGF
jgi:hypothetical protein